MLSQFSVAATISSVWTRLEFSSLTKSDFYNLVGDNKDNFLDSTGLLRGVLLTVGIDDNQPIAM